MNLTGLAYLLTVVIVALGILGQWGPPFLDGLWRLPAAAALLLLLFEGIAARRATIALRREVPSRLPLGTLANAALTFENSGKRPLRMETAEDIPEGIDAERRVEQWALEPGSSDVRSFSFTPVRLGPSEFNRINLRLLGRFGLAWWSRRITLSSPFEVVPDRLRGSEQRKISTANQGDRERRGIGHGHELLMLRDYQPGDPLHAVDWKATARSGQTTVRVYSREERLELVLLIDVGITGGIQAGALTRLGHYANVASRLAEKALAHGDRVHVVVFADEVIASLTSLRGPSAVGRIRSLLKGLKPIPRSSHPLPAVLRARSLARQRSLMVMLTDLDDGEAATQLVQAMALLRPKHLPLVAGIIDEEVLAMREAVSGDWLAPYQALAAYEAAGAWRHGKLHLERLGAHVILAPAAELDSRILSGYDLLKEQRRV